VFDPPKSHLFLIFFPQTLAYFDIQGGSILCRIRIATVFLAGEAYNL
jgi:hypothetical protein